MMFKYTFFSFLLTFCLLFQAKSASAQVDATLTISGDQLTVSYIPLAHYNTTTTNRWNSQVVTLRYPKTSAVNWSAFQNLGGFSFVQDTKTTTPVDGGDGYMYKVFSSSSIGTAINLSKDVKLDVFKVTIASTIATEFEIVTTNVWTKTTFSDLAINNASFGKNEFNTVVKLGSQKFIPAAPSVTIRSAVIGVTKEKVIPMVFTFSDTIKDFSTFNLDVVNGTVKDITVVDVFAVTAEIIPTATGTVTVTVPAGVVKNTLGNNNIASAPYAFSYSAGDEACLVTYYLEELPDGFYQVSMISHTDWTGTQAITATGQVTIMAGTSTSAIDSFNITDLTMMIPGVNWAQNSRYNAPTENPNQDYISFGLVSYGTLDIPYVNGDTVPLFRFKNTGICSEDSVYLMPITGDAFAYPNSLSANVGQQLSVSGNNEPDVALCVEGVASCMAEVTFDFKAILQGAYSASTGLMHDNLRALGLIPNQEPYTDYEPIRLSPFAPFQHFDDGGGETLLSTSLDARDTSSVVDWVLIELRSQHDSTQILSTRSALVQRNATIVDTTGVDHLIFRKLRSDKYFFTVRHRNHHALMSATEIPLVQTVNHFDFTDPATPVYGSNAGYVLGDKRLMWGGNSNADYQIMFQGGGIGEGLDIDNVFDNIFSDYDNVNYSYNHVRNGYYPGDNNLDGRVKYQGPANDVDQFIFFNIISRHPGNTNKFVNYYINQGLPK
jgi:Bacterial Ig-like domain